MDIQGPDFIVSELLSELKEENKRKDAQIKTLHGVILKVIIVAIASILITIGVCFTYLAQYDFSGTEEITTTKTADGTVAVIDSDDNTIGYDTSEEVEADGECDGNDH